MEAYKHPTYPRAMVIPGEDPAEFDALAADYYRRFAPTDIVERCYVNDLIHTVWSIRRVHRYIAQLSSSPRPETRAIDEMRQVLTAKERSYARVFKQLQTTQRKRQPKGRNTRKRGELASFRHQAPAPRRVVASKTSSGEWIH
ncbi:MAG: hypothetical protein NTW28_09945 [Candidatus Solibacter sp.]|nr:hypothetical protein [Candidatus Solibacter sp.]